jgi:hypothetical protein
MVTSLTGRRGAKLRVWRLELPMKSSSTMSQKILELQLYKLMSRCRIWQGLICQAVLGGNFQATLRPHLGPRRPKVWAGGLSQQSVAACGTGGADRFGWHGCNGCHICNKNNVVLTNNFMEY